MLQKVFKDNKVLISERIDNNLFAVFRDRSFFMREGGLVGFGKHHLKIA